MVHFPYYWDDDGACQYGYEGPIVEAFRDETGLDPHESPECRRRLDPPSRRATTP